MKKIISIIFIILLSSCGYNSIYQNTQSSNFKINIINMSGDKEINDEIKKQLNLKSKKNSKISYDISLDTTYNKIILSKDASGAITNYQIVVISNFKVNFKNQSAKFTFRESVKIKNISDSLEQLSYERNLKKSFANSLQNKLIFKLINLQ